MAKGSDLAPGDKVRLNDEGLAVCFGKNKVPYMQSEKEKILIVLDVDPNSMTTDVPSHLVTVDHPFYGGMLITNWGFDKV